MEVNDHGRLFYAVDCPRCGLHIPHAPAATAADVDDLAGEVLYAGVGANSEIEAGRLPANARCCSCNS